MVERSLPTPEDPGSNLVISNFLKNICLVLTVFSQLLERFLVHNFLLEQLF